MPGRAARGKPGWPRKRTATAFGGDVEALTRAVFGNPGAPDPRPAAMGNLDRVTADALPRTGEVPTFIAIEKSGRADAQITSYHNPREGDFEPVALPPRARPRASRSCCARHHVHDRRRMAVPRLAEDGAACSARVRADPGAVEA